MVIQGKMTTDRNVIEKWVEARHGWPAIKRELTSAEEELILSIIFPGHKEDVIRRLSWEEFFEKFDQQKLVFIYDESGAIQKPDLSYAFV